MMYFLLVILCAVIVYMVLAISHSRTMVEDMTIDYTERMISMVNQDIDSYVDNMSSFAHLVANSGSVRTFLFSVGDESIRTQAGEEVENQFDTLLNARKDIANIGIICTNGRYLFNDIDEELNPGANLEQTAWLQNAYNGKRTVTPSHVQNLIKNKYPWVVTLCEQIENRANTSLPGAVFLDLNFSTIKDLCEQASLGEKGYLFIVDGDGTIVYHPKQQLIYGGFITEEIDRVLCSETNRMYSSDGSKLYIIGKSEITGWTTVGVFYQEEMNARLRSIIGQYALISAVLLALASLLAIMLTDAVTSPIQKLRQAMSQVQNGDFGVDLEELKTGDEIGDLVESFETMTREINHLVEHNAQVQREKRKSEMKALQAQINPHFLYNTLDSIIWMSQAGKKQDVILMTSSLSKLLRRSISNPDEMVTLEDEIDHVRNYLVIQKMRYRDKLEYEIMLDEKLKKHEMIKLLLQPLVENAIYHGLKVKEGKGFIAIKEYVDGDTLCISVQDDGVGMSPEQLEHIFDEKKNSSGTGVGVYNVDRRIKIYYGEEYGLYYRSWQGAGTVATIRIPLSVDLENI